MAARTLESFYGQTLPLLLFVIPPVYLPTLTLGGTWEAVTLMLGTWMYNDLGGAENGPFIETCSTHSAKFAIVPALWKSLEDITSMGLMRFQRGGWRLSVM